MATILIIGQKFSTLTDYLLANGHTYLLLKDVLKAKSTDQESETLKFADFSSKQAVLAAIDNMQAAPDGIMVIYENYVLPAAWIAEHLNLPAISQAAAEASTDKFLMRSLFANAPEKISPDFATVESEEGLVEFANAHTFPLIMKPANLAKSLLVTKNDSLEQLIANYRKAVVLLDGVYKKYAPNRQPKLIIEEFLEGSIHSVDAFVDSAAKAHILEEIVDYQTGYDIGYEDNFHYSRLLPSTLTPSQQSALRHCAEVGIKALGITNSAAHVEIIMTKDGPRIVEIGARNGGYRDRMHALANGIDIMGNALKLALGEIPTITPSKNEPCAVLELFPKRPGEFIEVANEHSLKQLPSLFYYNSKIEAGQYVGKSSDGFKMTAVIILHSSDVEQFNRDLKYVNENVFVKTA